MELVELHDVMRHLAEARPVFHSEADFQHAVAWELHRRNPGAAVRLEHQVLPGMHLDVSASLDSRTTALELKYATRRLIVDHTGEHFHLRDHSAHDVKRYDVVKDIVRIERVVGEGLAEAGFVILLTNDPGYWRGGSWAATADASFRIHQGRTIRGTNGVGAVRGGWDDKGPRGSPHGCQGVCRRLARLQLFRLGMQHVPLSRR